MNEHTASLSAEADKTLQDNVHPPGWENPAPAAEYNLVVIGGGTAGLVTAAGAAQLGAKVALVERHLLGGDCLNVGCIPSKAIIRAARAIHDVKTAPDFSISGTEHAAIDFTAVMERMRRIRSETSAHDSARRFRDLGVDVFFGEGRFSGRDSIQVEGKTLRFRKAAICTGTRAARLPIPGSEETGYLTNETVFSLTMLPARLAVIGAGPIGCELAQAFGRLGSKVVLIGHLNDHILPREERDAAEIVQQAFAREGIELLLPATVIRAAARNGEKLLTVEREGAISQVVVDEILAGIGRVPDLERLDLEKGGIGFDPEQGITVNDRLQTSNPRVFAAGDVCFPYRFTHTADALARIVIANALFLGRGKSSALVVPWCTYTDPEVAHVGMYEKEARKKGIEVSTFTVPFSQVDRARVDGETEGFVRVHLKKGTDTIVGATVVGRHAGETIGEISLAMTAGIGLGAIGRTIHPYPTRAEAVRKVADAYNRTRLTPPIVKGLAAWLKYWRW